MKLVELLTTYWSQFTLILFGISYFLKRILDNISKKREINHSLFQQNKLNSLNNFYSIYSKTEQMWTSIPIYDVVDGKISAKQLDDYVFPLMNKLKRNVLELQIYFEEKEHNLFNEITENMIDIKCELGNVYFDNNNKPIENSNNFQYFRDLKLKENEQIFKKISQKIKQKFY